MARLVSNLTDNELILYYQNEHDREREFPQNLMILVVCAIFAFGVVSHLAPGVEVN